MHQDDKQIEIEIANRSSLVYLPIALVSVLTFLLASTLGEYPLVAKIGGTVWVGLLSLIVSMPVVTSRVKRYLKITHS